MRKINKIKFGFPSDSFLSQTIKLFEATGYEVNLKEDVYQLNLDDPEIECILASTEEITQYLEKEIIDAGISKTAFILDRKADVVELVRLNYGNKAWRNGQVVLAVPETSKIKSVKDLEGKKILARVPEITKNYLKDHKVRSIVKYTGRPGEPKIPTFGDALVAFTSTGAALRNHHLKILDILMETSPILAANKKSWQDKWKREKIENLAMLLKGARLAKEMAGLMLHASNEIMEEVFEVLPALKRPTITRLRSENWFDVLTVADKKELRMIIPKLKKIGCTDIVEFPLNKVVV